MCGWPSGVGYPPADGELERAAAAVPEAEESASTDGHDDVGVQLDALAGMVARQGQPMAEPSPDDQPEAAAEPTSPAASENESDDDPSADASSSDEAVDSPAEPDDIDPLTAPLTALSDDPELTADSQPSDEGLAPTATPVPDTDAVHGDESSAEVDFGAEEPDVVHALGESAKAPSRASAILRPAQVLLVGTAVANLVVIALGAVLGSSSGSTTVLILGLALTTLALWTGAAVTFLHWISRAHSHVAATAASRQRHGASMSLIGWFIPIAGFVIGYRVLQDLWTGSDPATRDDADATPAKVRMIDVWLLGIVTAAVFGYVMPLALGDSALWAGISGIGLLVAALGLVSTMGTISDWQSEPVAAQTPDVTSSAVNEPIREAPVSSAGTTKSEPTASQPVSAAAE